MAIALFLAPLLLAFAALMLPARAERSWILAATAHPYKFRDTVEPLIGQAIEPPPALGAILDRPTHKSTIDQLPRTVGGSQHSMTPPRDH